MILGDVQQSMLARELMKLVGYGRTRVNLVENKQGRGKVVLTRSGWMPTAPRGWYVTEEVTIGSLGKISRKRFTPPKSERESKGSN